MRKEKDQGEVESAKRGEIDTGISLQKSLTLTVEILKLFTANLLCLIIRLY